MPNNFKLRIEARLHNDIRNSYYSCYKGLVFEQPLRLDILIDDVLIVELKAIEKVLPIHRLNF